MLLVLIPLAIVFLAVGECVDALSLTLTLDILALESVAVLEHGATLAIGFARLHLSLVLSSVVRYA